MFVARPLCHPTVAIAKQFMHSPTVVPRGLVSPVHLFFFMACAHCSFSLLLSPAVFEKVYHLTHTPLCTCESFCVLVDDKIKKEIQWNLLLKILRVSLTFSAVSNNHNKRAKSCSDILSAGW